MKITSRANSGIIEASLLKEKKYREEKKKFIAEGIKLYKEASASQAEIERVYVLTEKLEICKETAAEKVYEVTEEVLNKISTEKSPEGVVCVIKAIDKIHIINKIYNVEEFKDRRKIMLLSSVRDPGNIGTIIRTAAAMGIDELILSSDCAEIYNPRAVRAAMGTLFRQRVTYVKDMAETVKTLKEAGYEVYAATLEKESKRLDETDISEGTAVIVGNEGHGISKEIVQAAGKSIYIPMEAGVESLNAATAAALFMWQIKYGARK